MLLVFSAAGAFQNIRRLDAQESAMPVDVPAPTAWDADFNRRRVFPVGRWTVPSLGRLQVTACGKDAAPAGLRLQIIDLGDPVSPRVSPDEPALTKENASSSRCATGVWRASHRQRVMARLVSAAPTPPSLTSLEVRSGGRIGAHNTWPMPLLVLGLIFIVMAPSWASSLHRRRDDDDIPEASPHHDRPSNPVGARTSVVPGEHAPSVMTGRAGPLLALLGMFVVVVGSQVPAALLGTRAVGLFASVLTQHALFVAVSAVMMGALRERDVRRALELHALPPRWVGRSVMVGLGLLAVALAVGALIPDPGETPLGRAIESTPVRYVIAYAALAAPLPEELFYRGVLVNAFKPLGAALQVALAAAVFAGMHAMQLQGAWLGLVPIALLGLVNGYLRVRTRRLVAPWIVHTVYNGLLASSVMLAP